MEHKERAMKLHSKDKYANLIGINVDEVSELYAKCSLEVKDIHLNCNNTVMGGVIFSLADFTFGIAANSTVLNCVTQRSSIDFIHEATGKMLYAEAKCLKDEIKLCIFAVTITDENDNIIAHALFFGYRHKEPRPLDK